MYHKIVVSYVNEYVDIYFKNQQDLYDGKKRRELKRKKRKKESRQKKKVKRKKKKTQSDAFEEARKSDQRKGKGQTNRFCFLSFSFCSFVFSF